MNITLRPVFVLLCLLSAFCRADFAEAHTVTLSWTASTTSGSTYNVYRQQACSGNFAQIASALSATAYLDGAVTPGETYCYEVTAAASGMESTASNPAPATIPATSPTQQGTTPAATSRNCGRGGSFFAWAKCVLSLPRRK